MNAAERPLNRGYPGRRPAAVAAAITAVLAVVSCSRAVYPPRGTTQTGIASWYGRDFHGRPTASSEIYNMNDMTAAHPTLPFGTSASVTNLENGRSAVVRINDRGPFVRGRIIDLSYAAARVLGLIGPGTARVRVEVLRDTRDRDRVSRFSVQVGSFAVQENAYALKRSLEAAYDGVYVSRFRTPSQVFYRVRVSAGSRKDAEKIARRLAGDGFAVIVNEDR